MTTLVVAGSFELQWLSSSYFSSISTQASHIRFNKELNTSLIKMISKWNWDLLHRCVCGREEGGGVSSQYFFFDLPNKFPSIKLLLLSSSSPPFLCLLLFNYSSNLFYFCGNFKRRCNWSSAAYRGRARGEKMKLLPMWGGRGARVEEGKRVGATGTEI